MHDIIPTFDDTVLPIVEDLDEIEMFDDGMDEMNQPSLYLGDEF